MLRCKHHHWKYRAFCMRVHLKKDNKAIWIKCTAMSHESIFIQVTGWRRPIGCLIFIGHFKAIWVKCEATSHESTFIQVTSLTWTNKDSQKPARHHMQSVVAGRHLRICARHYILVASSPLHGIFYRALLQKRPIIWRMNKDSQKSARHYK